MNQRELRGQGTRSGKRVKRRLQGGGENKKPTNAYFLWFQEEGRQQVVEENSDLGVLEVAEECGAMWNNMSDKEKKKWEDKNAKRKKKWNDPVRSYFRRLLVVTQGISVLLHEAPYSQFSALIPGHRRLGQKRADGRTSTHNTLFPLDE